MHHNITIFECTTYPDEQVFWQYLKEYFVRDIHPDEPDYVPCPPDYEQSIDFLREREYDRARFLIFRQDNQDVGIAMSIISEWGDKRHYIMEFCVFPAFRGGGMGLACAQLLIEWGQKLGCLYVELNADTPQRQRFWSRLGFIPNGYDQFDSFHMLLPPKEEANIYIGENVSPRLLRPLLGGFRHDVGEPLLTYDQTEALEEAIHDHRIIFLVALRLNRYVGMCSLSPYYSTYRCAPCYMLDDFYIEPYFRGKGIASKLISAAREYCESHGGSALTVGCSAGDEEMYRHLGFDTKLGTLLAYNLPDDAH